jgi:ATP-dependent RNA helicase DHX37/DHR1
VQVLTQLNSSSLPEEQLSLLRPLHQRGARETKKQRLRRLLKLQRAGFADVDGSNELLQERQVKGVAGSNSESEGESEGSSESDSDDEEEQQWPAKQARIEPAAAADPAAAAGQSSSSSEEGEDGQQQQQSEDEQEHAAQYEAAAAAAAKSQLKAVKAQAAALKAQARLEATGMTSEADTSTMMTFVQGSWHLWRWWFCGGAFTVRS